MNSNFFANSQGNTLLEKFKGGVCQRLANQTPELTNVRLNSLFQLRLACLWKTDSRTVSGISGNSLIYNPFNTSYK